MLGPVARVIVRQLAGIHAGAGDGAPLVSSGWPGLQAVARAGAYPGCIFGEDVQGHALAVDQQVSQGGITGYIHRDRAGRGAGGHGCGGAAVTGMDVAAVAAKVAPAVGAIVSAVVGAEVAAGVLDGAGILVGIYRRGRHRRIAGDGCRSRGAGRQDKDQDSKRADPAQRK